MGGIAATWAGASQPQADSPAMPLLPASNNPPASSPASSISSTISNSSSTTANRTTTTSRAAASYFQRMMASIVLAGLLYITVELYLDDVLVLYATTEEEFIERLGKLFQRFRQHNITLNPKKCAFGMEEIEFVGHILTQGRWRALLSRKEGKGIRLSTPEKAEAA